MSWTLRLDGAGAPDRALVGGKAWSIANMLALGIRVPPAFVVTTPACAAYQAAGDMPDGLEAEITDGLAWLEQQTGRSFGTGDSPLLLSVRSGAAVSMPGMMDTVLNLGIGDATEAALAAETGRADFARDTHRRFLELYAAIVMKAPAVHLEPADPPVDWRAAIATAAGSPVPDDPRAQLIAAVRAVFDSWNSRRARKYRQHNGIPDDLGTAVTIQAMVFGNLGDDSGTGVLFSRNPLSGEAVPFGEYLPRAQGEDVVSGRFTPLPLTAMRDQAPAAHAELLAASAALERDGGDMQDIEFTVQRGRLFLLQSRTAKRAPAAAVRCAVEMAQDGTIDRATAISRVSVAQVADLRRPRLADGATDGLEPVARGEGACPGIGSGIVVSSSDEAERRAATGEAVVLVRQTTSPDDVHGMIASTAVITAEGGATSHAAVVSRALGRPCVVGCGPDVLALVGDTVTVDGDGLVWGGRLPMVIPVEADDPLLATLLGWARDAGDARFDTPADVAALQALEAGHA